MTIQANIPAQTSFPLPPHKKNIKNDLIKFFIYFFA